MKMVTATIFSFLVLFFVTAKAIQDYHEAKAAEEGNKALEDAKGEDGLITPTEQQAIEKRTKRKLQTLQRQSTTRDCCLDPSKGKRDTSR
ncbi:hypothetical protein [Psychrobacter lutiphocae]|uniref:hypothetical protein n=1 Tax=Psychrobacter lutiphocae TaxID=540500 RepID=UPI00191806FD|nr:hypothetical protein [Psychrobacter lutiphocae]